MQKYKYTECDEVGRSMIEIIGVLAIMGLITAGAMVLIRSGMASHKRSRTFDETMAIVENVRGLYPDGFTDLTPIRDEGTKLIDGMYLNTMTPFGAGTKYSLRGYGEKDYFAVFIEGLDADDCMVLATQTWPDAWDTSCFEDTGTLWLRFGR